jgi:hypothetical protein
MRTPEQFLKIDETRFCSRPERVMKRKIIYRSDCPVQPAFREQTEPNHSRLVATITFSGDVLKLMLLVTALTNFIDPSITELASDIVACRTAKDYQTHKLMSVNLPDVLAPYCQCVRHEIKDQILSIIMMIENCGFHKKDALSDVYAALNIRIIWFLPHSSHFLQPLDLVLFTRLKIKYQKHQAGKTKPK